jgi:ParB-like chromosome segregation protein Spo0J
MSQLFRARGAAFRVRASHQRTWLEICCETSCKKGAQAGARAMSADKLRDAFAKNIRSITGLDDTELYESLKHHGWHPEFPAVADENGVVLVGHRRMRLAKQLGLEPVIRTITFGNGDAADAERVRLAIVSNVGSQPFSRDDRKRIAEHLYGTKEWTMEAIAKALDVSHQTIGCDLADLSTVDKSKPAKTATNPKGAGRPKGVRAPESHYKETVVTPRDEPEIERSALPMTSQQKVDAVLRRLTRKLEAEFDDRVRAEMKRYLDDVALPHYAKEIANLERSIRERKGIMTKSEYRILLFCCHPDRVAHLNDEQLTRRFRDAKEILDKIEKRVLDEKKSPTQFTRVPPTAEELMKMKARKQAEDRAKRAARKTE